MPSPDAAENTPLVQSKISRSTKFSYALAHVFNDLAAAMWFSYTLLFLQRVSLLQPVVAGALMLLGKFHLVYQVLFYTDQLINKD